MYEVLTLSQMPKAWEDGIKKAKGCMDMEKLANKTFLCTISLPCVFAICICSNNDVMLRNMEHVGTILD